MTDNVARMPGPRAVVVGERGGYLGCLARGGRIDPAAKSFAVLDAEFGPCFAAAWRIAKGPGLPLSIETKRPPDPVVVILAFIGTVAVASYPLIEQYPDREFAITKLGDAQTYARTAASVDGRSVWNTIVCPPSVWRPKQPKPTGSAV